MLNLKEAAERLGTSEMRLLELIDVGAVTPSKLVLHDGKLWDRKTEIGVSPDDLTSFQAELERRRFPHVFEQFGYVVEPDAAFAFGPGWENVLRSALTKLTAIPGPPRVAGGKEKFGAMVLYISHDRAHTDEINAIRAAYKLFSEETCEECGKPGHLRKGVNLWKTTCEKHAHLVGELREDGKEKGGD